ncbi:MAG: phosphoribosylformylglycinamidine synthase subunit PurQ [Flavobacteriaceae bacterium]
MKSAILLFPGLNRERDMATALERASGSKPAIVWHTETTIPDADVIVVPGGFSYGDYLRCGAIAARSPVMADLARKAAAGVTVLGVCNGFQILTEAGLLPGALMRNAGLKFVCREIRLKVERNDTRFTSRYARGDVFRTPVAHGDGNYFADDETLKRVEGEGLVVLRYADGTNPNGSVNDIAGVMNEAGNVLGMMPHPENMIDPLQGGTDGFALFESLFSAPAGKAA